MVKDYILCLDCEEAENTWEAAWWDRDAALLAARAAAAAAGNVAEPEPVTDPADDYNTLASGTAGERKFEQCIRRSIFEKTLGQNQRAEAASNAEELLERQHDARS